MDKLFKSDLACDTFNKNYHSHKSDISQYVKSINGYDVIYTEIKDAKKHNFFKDGKEKYATLCTGNISILAKQELETIENSLTSIITDFIGPLYNKKVIVVGLGNRNITSDSLGPSVIDEMIPTRHLIDTSPDFFKKIDCCEITLLAPGVIGQSGVSSYEKIQILSNHIHPDIIFTIDSLATSNPTRLLSTIQITNVGIMPGSGMNLRGYELSKNTLGIDVISIGVPTVISASTLVSSFSKDKINIESLSELHNLYVSPNDCDEAIKKFSKLIGKSLQSALCKKIQL